MNQQRQNGQWQEGGSGRETYQGYQNPGNYRNPSYQEQGCQGDQGQSYQGQSYQGQSYQGQSGQYAPSYRQSDPAQEARPERRRRRPAMAGSGQKMVILGLAIAVIFLLGTLSGLGLAYNAWVRNGTVQDGTVQEDTVQENSQSYIRVPAESASGDGEQTAPSETEPPVTAPQTTGAPETAPTQPETAPAPSEPPVTVSAETTQPVQTETSEYILPDSSRVYLAPEDYQNLSDWELILARNEIFARHGRRFNDPDIQAYFNGCSWYHGTIAPEDFDPDVFNDVELKNIQVLKAASDAR